MRINIENEILPVKELGEKIGYGNMMSIASALWRKSFRDRGEPAIGAFTPCIKEQLDADDIYYDQMINEALDEGK